MTPIIELSENGLTKVKKSRIKHNPYPLKGFIYVDSIDLYVAEEESHLRQKWHETNEALLEEDSRIPTILEFVVFFNYIRKEYPQLYKKITQVKDSGRIEWLDAYFKKRKDGLYVLTGNQKNFEKTEDGLYVLTRNKTNAQKLENVLMKEREISFALWLEDPNLQGLPRQNIKKPDTDKDKVIYYPPKEEGRVAGFEISPIGGMVLDCDLNPDTTDTDLVSVSRAVKDGAKVREKYFGIITPAT